MVFYLALHRIGAVTRALHSREGAIRLRESMGFLDAKPVATDAENLTKAKAAGGFSAPKPNAL